MILVTGGAGYIGSHTVVELLAGGHELLILDNFSNSSPHVLERIAHITSKQPKCIEGDIRDGALLDRLFAAHAISAVIHFAGLKAVGESVEEPMRYCDNNVVGSLRLFEDMTKAGVFRLVFSSSATVYGDPQAMPTLTNPTYNSSTGLLTWSGTRGNDVTIPAGQAISLDITPNQAGVSFQIRHDSQLYPSKITMPVSTFINVNSVDVYKCFLS